MGTPRNFSDFCQKIGYFEKYLGVPPDFFQIFVKQFPYFQKKISYREIFWGIPKYFSDFCPKNRFFAKFI